MHANFKLSNLGEQLILTNADSVVIDSITYLIMADDIAFARLPNGSGTFIMQAPTFKANNDFANSITDKKEQIKVYPNPFSDVIKWNSFEGIIKGTTAKIAFLNQPNKLLSLIIGEFLFMYNSSLEIARFKYKSEIDKLSSKFSALYFFKAFLAFFLVAL